MNPTYLNELQQMVQIAGDMNLKVIITLFDFYDPTDDNPSNPTPNEARNKRRSAGRREALALRASPGEAAPSPEEAAAAAEERARLLAALDRLKDDHRLVLACRHVLDLSEIETAAALGVRVGTVKSRTARALDALRETYGS